MNEKEVAQQDEPKDIIKERVVNIGDLLGTTESGEEEVGGETQETEPSDRSFEPEQQQQQQPQKSWNERIPRMFSRVTAVGLPDQKKEEYIGDTEEVVAIMCEFFDAEHNLPLLLQELGSGELTPKQSVMYLGICMIGYLAVARMGLLEKIGEKLKLRDKKEVKK